MSLFFANFMFLLTSVAGILASFGLVDGRVYEKNLSARPLLFFHHKTKWHRQILLNSIFFSCSVGKIAADRTRPIIADRELVSGQEERN